MEAQMLLRAEGIDKSFGPTHAVDHVSLDFNAGEIHALIGENGSGKSTFTNMLTGILPIGAGTFTLEGKRVAPKNQVDANHLGIAVIVQEAGTLSGLTVAENMFLGDEGRFMHNGIKDTAALMRKAQELLDGFGLDRIRAGQPIDNYNFEDRKLVEILRATWFEPKVLVVDETTTALSQAGREELFEVMRHVRAQGHCVIFISHDMPEVLAMSDRISVLRDGVYVKTVAAADMTEDSLKTLMVGREMDEHYYRTDYPDYATEPPGEVAVFVENVSVPGELDDVSLYLSKGEILGIGGLSECGMHELGKAIFGASYGRTGEVRLGDGTQIDDINTAINHSMAYASKNRDEESLLVNDTIQDNIALPSMRDMGRILSNKRLKKFARKYAEVMSVKMVDVNQYVSALSGGNKQKVVLARWLGKESSILILDSPTRGIDIKVKADIYALLEEMRNQNKATLIISEEIMELIGMCDRILVMKDGKIAGQLLRSPDLTERDVIAKMI
ncbi:monosaccharide ABC transporter ATP-binding protein, CUT2 family [Coriobacterium glomerans PW2]|uniref:Monosaccharide ABC transporter ATP-binding protein, CUT2 family n=1 Tax=Coriobacterium glomerans (strain ATCC 49209 / DSM 20642 / JCM 10262 / PW2) TaxID=700015 RepID=F2NAF2_CORGP|nr:sugar ABC transporter ATP-binding protein [Coriobacterium glomerans]AEB06479.1 monosaccharide ABC transporter ATP-binding protein, CUT2 family [Coriobacterium glomerans PW2]